MDRQRDYSSGLQNPCVDIDMNTVHSGGDRRREEAGESDGVHFPSVIISVISFLLLTEVKKTKNQNDTKRLASPSQLRR